MGLNVFFSSSSYDGPMERPVLPNPDPNNYTIVKYEQWLDKLVVLVKYHDCTNYEGQKVLVFLGITIHDLRKQNSLDPHFSESKEFYSPIARFEPTNRGWQWAVEFARKG